MAARALDPLEGVTIRWARSAAREGGDPAAFARLYDHIAPSGLTWAQLRVRGPERAVRAPTDLVQEVWMRAWRRIEDFNADQVPFRFWVFRIAKTVLLEANRQARRPDRRAPTGLPRDEGDQDPLAQVADTITAVSKRLAKDENLGRFMDFVNGLPDDDRALVLHCGLEGLPLKDVGARLGISEDAATKRWQRLRARLREAPALQDLPEHLLVSG